MCFSFYSVFNIFQVHGNAENLQEEQPCANCVALRAELQLCRENSEQQLQTTKDRHHDEMESLKKEVREKINENEKVKDDLRKKLLSLNNKLEDVKAELNRTQKQSEKPCQPSQPQRRSIQTSVVVQSVTNAVG